MSVSTCVRGRRRSKQNIARVEELWNESRAAIRIERSRTCAARFSIADCFYAPVAFRFQTYGVTPQGDAKPYLSALLRASVRARMGSGGAGGDDGHRGRRAARRLSRQAPRRRPLVGPMADPALAALQDTVRAAADARRPLTIRGGGTKAFYGEAVAGRHCRHDCACRHRRLRAHRSSSSRRAWNAARRCRERRCAAQRTDARLRAAAFRVRRRRWAVRSRRASPGRDGRTRARRAILCWAFASSTATGEDARFGGRVMKNVAGFDVVAADDAVRWARCGVITEVSLKCLPLPKAEATSGGRMLGRRIDPPRESLGRASAAALRNVLARRATVGAALRRRARGRRGDAVDWGRRRSRRRGVLAQRPRSHRIRSSSRRGSGDVALWRLSVKASAAATCDRAA